MKRLLTTTALGMVLLSINAYAAPMDPQSMYTAQTSDIRASEFIGTRVYASEKDYSANETFKTGEDKHWDDIGEINDVILDKEGDVEAVIVGVGGFVGIGEKDVAIPMSGIEFVRDSSVANEYKLIVNANKQVLTDAPEYDMRSENQAKVDDTDAAMKDEETASSVREPLTSPNVAVDGYTTAKAEELTAEMLTGTSVYGPKNQEMGEVEKVLLSNDGSVEQLVLDIGGFLGLGEHRIAVDPEEVNIVREDGGNDVRVYVDSNEEALTAQPEYDAG